MSCKPRAIELALIAEAPPMFIMQSMINLQSQTSNLKSSSKLRHFDTDSVSFSYGRDCGACFSEREEGLTRCRILVIEDALRPMLLALLPSRHLGLSHHPGQLSDGPLLCLNDALVRCRTMGIGGALREHLVVAGPGGEAQRQAPCTLQLKPHARARAVGLRPVVGEGIDHLHAIGGDEGRETAREGEEFFF